jgi:addiction module RelB/DinJ family antitoxin
MANGKSNINVKIDTDVKTLAARLLDRMGLDEATAIDMFFRQIIAERRLPFQPMAAPTLDEQIAGAAVRAAQSIIELPADENGNILVDKDMYPELYEWAAKG